MPTADQAERQAAARRKALTSYGPQMPARNPHEPVRPSVPFVPYPSRVPPKTPQAGSGAPYPPHPTDQAGNTNQITGGGALPFHQPYLVSEASRRGDAWSAAMEARYAQPALGVGGGVGGGSSGGGGLDGGGGGGAGGDGKAGALQQIASMLAMLKAGQYDPTVRTYQRDQAGYDRVAAGVSADRSNASGAYDQLDAFLANQGPNAYSQMASAQGPQGDTSMLSLLASQGGDEAAYKAQAQFQQQTGGAQADAYNRMVQALRGGEDANRLSRGAESAQARAYADREISSQSLGLNTALDLQGAERSRQVDDQNFAASEAAKQQKLQIFQQLSALAAQFGLGQPTLEQFGVR